MAWRLTGFPRSQIILHGPDQTELGSAHDASQQGIIALEGAPIARAAPDFCRGPFLFYRTPESMPPKIQCSTVAQRPLRTKSPRQAGHHHPGDDTTAAEAARRRGCVIAVARRPAAWRAGLPGTAVWSRRSGAGRSARSRSAAPADDRRARRACRAPSPKPKPPPIPHRRWMMRWRH